MALVPTENLILNEIQQLKIEARKTNEILDAIYRHLIDHVGKP